MHKRRWKGERIKLLGGKVLGVKKLFEFFENKGNKTLGREVEGMLCTIGSIVTSF